MRSLAMYRLVKNQMKNSNKIIKILLGALIFGSFLDYRHRNSPRTFNEISVAQYIIQKVRGWGHSNHFFLLDKHFIMIYI